MSKKRKAVSCGTCPYRVVNGLPGPVRVEVLLVKPMATREFWGMAKGHVDPGESYEDCARRETREETGIEVTLEETLPSFEVKNKDENKTVYMWLARQSCANEPRPQDGENVEVGWWDINELPPIMVTQRATVDEAVRLIRLKTNYPNLAEIVNVEQA